jgi:hypothetical protein
MVMQMQIFALEITSFGVICAPDHLTGIPLWWYAASRQGLLIKRRSRLLLYAGDMYYAMLACNVRVSGHYASVTVMSKLILRAAAASGAADGPVRYGTGPGPYIPLGLHAKAAGQIGPTACHLRSSQIVRSPITVASVDNLFV